MARAVVPLVFSLSYRNKTAISWPHGRLLFSPVNKVEYHRSSLEPLSTVIDGPDAVGFRQSFHQRLNQGVCFFVIGFRLALPRSLIEICRKT